MARENDGGNNDLQLSFSAVSAAPITMRLLLNLDATGSQWMYEYGDASDATHQWYLFMNAGTSTCSARVQAGGSLIVDAVAGSPTINTGTWYSVVLRDSGTTIRTSFDGTHSSGTAHTEAPTGLDTVSIFRRINGGTDVDGRIAEVAIWNVELSDAELNSMAPGSNASPRFVRPSALKLHAPLIRETSELIGGTPFAAAQGATTIAAHPPVVYPASPYRITAPAAAAGITVPEMVASMDMGRFPVDGFREPVPVGV